MNNNFKYTALGFVAFLGFFIGFYGISGNVASANVSTSTTASIVATSTPIMVNVTAITCATESDLPNWGDGAPDVISSTATSYVAAHSTCHLASGWNFQWGLGAGSPTPVPRDLLGSFVGPVAGANASLWTTFGPTNGSGATSATFSNLNGGSDVWIRENLQTGYVPFSELPISPVGHKDNFSAELYCATDGRNYDNYDSPYYTSDQYVPSHTFYCVAFNTLIVATTTATNTPPIVTVVGSNPFTLIINTTFTDPGATATDTEDGNLTSSIVATGTVSTTTVGSYPIVYSVTDSGGLSASSTRTVNVVAATTTATNTPPIVTVVGSNPFTLIINTVFTDPGATATDTEDGSLTSSIVATGTVSTTTVGSYPIVYSVTDSGGLSASSTRTVNVVAATTTATNTPPTINIVGSNPLTIDINTIFTDPGATATDTEDGSLTSSIVTTGTVGTTTVGSYTVTYTVTDSGGLGATSTRTVNVIVPITGGGGTSGTLLVNQGGSSSSGSVLSVTGNTTLGAPISCILLYSYLQYGRSNDPVEVLKLQSFLKRVEGYDIDLTGTFDLKTLAGVNAFQTKYLSSVMGPWGASQSSGYVYITTKKKVNEIACNVAFVINSAEQTIIDAYKATQASASAAQNSSVGPSNPSSNQVSPPEVSTSSPDIGFNEAASSSNANTAAVINAPASGGFWNFVRGLFTR